MWQAHPLIISKRRVSDGFHFLLACGSHSQDLDSTWDSRLLRFRRLLVHSKASGRPRWRMVRWSLPQPRHGAGGCEPSRTTKARRIEWDDIERSDEFGRCRSNPFGQPRRMAGKGGLQKNAACGGTASSAIVDAGRCRS